MIRIDEIYNNIFLPQLQAKPEHGLHWFDPFGSVKYADLCNVPAIADTDSAVRYLFVDQEPVHTAELARTLRQFVWKFPRGSRHIVTSEYCSEAVDDIARTYGFVPHYYFFHGWAALDWFRGYNRSFLMPDIKDRRIRHTFVMPNRIVAGEREHRLILLYHIFRQNMHNNHISCPSICPAENVSILDAIKPLETRYTDIAEVFSNTQFPKSFVGEANAPMHSYQLSLFPECAESLLYLVTETIATGRRNHLTEKTFKPIALKMPFVIAGTAHSLEYLRSYGFQTFGTLWDESYDLELDDDVRLAKIAETLKHIDELPAQCKQKLLQQAGSICEHNYNHFYSGAFEAILWQELTGVLQELERA